MPAWAPVESPAPDDGLGVDEAAAAAELGSVDEIEVCDEAVVAELVAELVVAAVVAFGSKVTCSPL